MTAERIRQRLVAVFCPEHIDLQDESHRHIGHAGNKGGGHYRLLMVSTRFEGQNRLTRQRLVQQTLADLYNGEIHALSLTLYTPAEYLGRQAT